MTVIRRSAAMRVGRSHKNHVTATTASTAIPTGRIHPLDPGGESLTLAGAVARRQTNWLGLSAGDEVSTISVSQ
jgi:hypothetical protein